MRLHRARARLRKLMEEPMTSATFSPAYRPRRLGQRKRKVGWRLSSLVPTARPRWRPRAGNTALAHQHGMRLLHHANRMILEPRTRGVPGSSTASSPRPPRMIKSGASLGS